MTSGQPPQGGERVLTLKSPNGEELTAPAGVWLLALYDLMPDEDRSLLFDRVKRMRDDIVSNQNIVTPPSDIIVFKGGGLGPILAPALSPKFSGGKANSVIYDKGGKRHIRMHAETGHYFKKRGEKKERVNL